MESSEKGKYGQDSVLDLSDDRRVWIVPENEFDPQILNQLPLVSFPDQSQWIVSPPHHGQDGLAFWIPVKTDSKETVKRKAKSPHSVIRPTVPPKRKEGYLPNALAGVVDSLWGSRDHTGQLSTLLSDTTRPFAPRTFEHVVQLRADNQQGSATPRGDGCTDMSAGDAETALVDPNLSQAVADIETNTGSSSQLKRDAIEQVICTPS
ncbi:Hypp8619 [Branchiostoma lanceolatum]|uniref:Hypp8619 protein n=1 Tax=Branchiostoma lanceolatum TaxID=7740 RepID=A0A8J9Z9A5_BRALA|nr:Hypp8619 [Branchiostoma lanceolatum]